MGACQLNCYLKWMPYCHANSKKGEVSQSRVALHAETMTSWIYWVRESHMTGWVLEREIMPTVGFTLQP